MRQALAAPLENEVALHVVSGIDGDFFQAHGALNVEFDLGIHDSILYCVPEGLGDDDCCGLLVGRHFERGLGIDCRDM